MVLRNYADVVLDTRMSFKNFAKALNEKTLQMRGKTFIKLLKDHKLYVDHEDDGSVSANTVERITESEMSAGDISDENLYEYRHRVGEKITNLDAKITKLQEFHRTVVDQYNKMESDVVEQLLRTLPIAAPAAGVAAPSRFSELKIILGDEGEAVFNEAIKDEKLQVPIIFSTTLDECDITRENIVWHNARIVLEKQSWECQYKNEVLRASSDVLKKYLETNMSKNC